MTPAYLTSMYYLKTQQIWYVEIKDYVDQEVPSVNYVYIENWMLSMQGLYV